MPQRRALITDYLLGQLPPRVAETARDRPRRTPRAERAWARVLAAELSPLARGALPEIPAAAAAAAPSRNRAEAQRRTRSRRRARRRCRRRGRPPERPTAR